MNRRLQSSPLQQYLIFSIFSDGTSGIQFIYQLEHPVFSRDEATLYERVSVRPSVRPLVRWSVTLSFFGLLGATNAVYTAP